MVNNKKDLQRIYTRMNERFGISRNEYDDMAKSVGTEAKHKKKDLNLQKRIEDEERMMQRDERAGNEDTAARRAQEIARLKQRQTKVKTKIDRAQNSQEKIDNPS